MNSFERVKAAIHFQNPDRVPIWRAGIADIMPLAQIPSKSWQPGHIPEEQGLFPYLGDPSLRFLYRWKRPTWALNPKFKNWGKIAREDVDEWGCIWNRDDHNASLGHPGRAALSSWEDFSHYLDLYHPDPMESSRYRLFSKLGKLIPGKRYRMAMFMAGGPFQTAMNIRGFNHFLTDHRRNPIQLKELLKNITQFYIDQQRAWFKYGGDPHGFIMYDDLGEQLRPYLSTSVFREFYAPIYQQLIQTAHDLKCEFHLHSCGKIDPYLPTLIELGLDAIELDSPRMCGYPDLNPYRGKIMFWGCVNIQSIYTQGSPSECERETWHMIRNLGTPQGGFGAYFYPQANHIQAPQANIKGFTNGLKKYGRYRNIPSWWWEASIPSEWDSKTVPPLPRK